MAGVLINIWCFDSFVAVGCVCCPVHVFARVVLDTFLCDAQNASAAPAGSQPRPMLTGGPSTSGASSAGRVPTPDELSTIQYLRSQLGQATQDLKAVKGNLAMANSKGVQAAAREHRSRQ